MPAPAIDFGFGSARSLYAKNIHPRLFFGAADLPRVRAALETKEGRKIGTAFRRSARKARQRILELDAATLVESFHATGTPSAGAGRGVMNVAFLAALDEDADAAEAVRRVLAACPKVEAAAPGGGQTRHRLGCSMSGTLARAYDMVQPLLPEQDRRTFCSWVYRHGVARTLREILPQYYLCAGMNIPMSQLLNTVGVLLALDGEDGVPDLAKDWQRALSMFEATVNTVVGPNGYPAEDMGYGTGMFGRVAQTAELLRRAGIFDAYAECPGYSRFGNAMLHLVQPWGMHLSTTGDHGDDFGQRLFVLTRLAAETGNDALLWLLGTLSYGSGETSLGRGLQIENSIYSVLLADQLQTKKMRPPARLKRLPETSFCDRARGIVTFRSGWQPKDCFVVFDGSRRTPAAQGHEHASCGHFSISAFGEYFAVDSGRYNLEQNCHNVALIDGQSGRSTDGEWLSMKHHGVLTGFAPGKFVDVAAVDSSLQHNCMWAWRRLGLVKGKGAPPYVWVVDDINKHNDWAEYWWQLHTCPENTIRLYRRHATITCWRRGNKMDVHFALPPGAQYSRPHQLLGLSQDLAEPSSYKYVGPFSSARLARFDRPADQLHYSTFQRPRLIAKIGGLNGRIMAVMLPREKNAAPAKVTQLSGLPGSLAVRIVFGDVEDTVIFAHEHRLLEAGGVSARGQWCVVRRSRKTGKIIEQATGEDLG